MDQAAAQNALASTDPTLQEAGEAVIAELPMEPDQRMQFGILAILAAIASILTIISYCKSRDATMSGLALKETAHTLTAYGRHQVWKRVRWAIKRGHQYHDRWDLRKQSDEMTAALFKSLEKAEPGRIEKVVGAALRHVDTGNAGEP
jgi:hypothetical protein